MELLIHVQELSWAPFTLPLILFYFLLFLSYFSFFTCLYSIEYARITSTIGARHNGHLPPPRTNSFAHFEQVHMCPHLQSVIQFLFPEKGKPRITITDQNVQAV